MPHLVRERLCLSDISDAIAALTESHSTPTFTHVLSVVSSTTISFITDCRPGLADGKESAPPTAAVPPGTLMRVVERAGGELRVTRMAVPLRDTEENLLDHLELCLDFIEEGRKVGNVLVHYFAGYRGGRHTKHCHLCFRFVGNFRISTISDNHV
ncbi:hypothetical protein C2845_PM02G27040 [Panicum miliaceum]|uniref:protein-tyrosine-phosphatase n=1 Tax=Panicum miliaceum TaxID=4540 RepID=A0A3L6SBU1_PANMI|nr:hypothetical protein C2845_PM02G27040 [Panicum miliaceum]